MSASPRILIVVLNYQTPALTLRCANSLAPTLQQFPGAELVIVDNGSGADFVASLSAGLGTSNALASLRERVRLFCLAENGGFAAGNNAAIREALASRRSFDYCWLLNSDTEVRPMALQALISAMQANPRLGIAGSRLENEDGTPQRSAFRFPTIAGEWEANIQWGWITRLLSRSVIALPPSDLETSIDWVPGASMLVRRAVFDEIGLLDEGYFMYFEDVDYCHRASNAGWEIRYVPASRVIHKTEGLSDLAPSSRARQRMPRYRFAARRRYFVKFHGRLYARCADAAWLLGFGIRRIRRFLQGKPDTYRPRLWLDFLEYSIGRTRTPG